MIKTILKSFIFQWIISLIASAYCMLTYLTCRVKIDNKEHLEAAMNSPVPTIIACWHGRLFFTPLVIKKAYRTQLFSIISRHGDGELIAKASSLFGFKSIRGSTNRTSDDARGAKDRGGQHVLREIFKTLKQNNNIFFTPDGPRGPRMQIVETAILNLAERTQANIVPVTASASRVWVINSWDQFIIPKPFSKIYITFDSPIAPPLGNDKKNLENTRKILEDRLNIITNLADKQMGIEPIKPMPRT